MGWNQWLGWKISEVTDEETESQRVHGMGPRSHGRRPQPPPVQKLLAWATHSILLGTRPLT